MKINQRNKGEWKGEKEEVRSVKWWKCTHWPEKHQQGQKGPNQKGDTGGLQEPECSSHSQCA